MAKVYELIGRAVVRMAWFQFGRQIKVAGVVLGALAAAGIYLAARREPPEG